MVKSFRLLTSQQAKSIDIKAKDILGISTLVLMENAGRHIAEEAIKTLPGKRNVAIFCGKGNNGGDGFVTARHLLTYGIKPDIFLGGMISEIRNEARINLEILLKLNQKIVEVKEGNFHFIKSRISEKSLVIDALLGVGLKGEVKGVFCDLIRIINASKAYVLSVDIPSGLDATTGKVLGCCVKANKTVTFLAKKRGMVVGEGSKYCGKIVVKDLGIPL